MTAPEAFPDRDEEHQSHKAKVLPVESVRYVPRSFANLLQHQDQEKKEYRELIKGQREGTHLKREPRYDTSRHQEKDRQK